MFIHNKYTKIYFSIISRAKSRVDVPSTHKELHHIVPRSLGGGDATENLVYLTPREHYISHALLPKMVIGDARYKMLCAFNMMHVGHNGKRYTSVLYEYYKIKFYREHSIKQMGKVRTLESRLKQSSTTKGRPWTERAKNTKRRKPTAKRVCARNKHTNVVVGVYDSVSLCARALKCDTTTIWKICEGKPSRPAPNGNVYPMKSHKGYTFTYVD